MGVVRMYLMFLHAVVSKKKAHIVQAAVAAGRAHAAMAVSTLP